MEHICPHCQSTRITSLDRGRKTCSAIGSIAGASIAIHNIRLGVSLGRFLGPPGIVVGGVSGLVFAGLSGAILGGSTGARLGSMLDNNVLNNHRCLDCKKSFSAPGRSFEYSHSAFDDEADESELPTFHQPD